MTGAILAAAARARHCADCKDIPLGQWRNGSNALRLSAAGSSVLTWRRPPARLLFPDFLDSVYNGKTVGLSLQDIYRANEIVLAARERAERRTIIRT